MWIHRRRQGPGGTGAVLLVVFVPARTGHLEKREGEWTLSDPVLRNLEIFRVLFCFGV